jgi:transposase-like protein
MKKKRKASDRGKRKRITAPAYPPEFSLKVVRLYLEEGYKISLLAQEFTLAGTRLEWIFLYREHGELGRFVDNYFHSRASYTSCYNSHGLDSNEKP